MVKKLFVLGFLFLPNFAGAMMGAGQFDSSYRSENIIFHYKMDENGGTSVKNSFGTAGNGTWEGSGNTWVSGEFQSAVDFNGFGGIDIPDSSAFDMSNFTILAWVKPRGVNANSQFIIGQAAAQNWGFLLSGSDNKLICRTNPDGAECQTPALQISSGVWTCVAMRWNTVRTEKCTFANGQKSCSFASGNTYNLGDNPEIGCNAACANNQYSGAIDSIMMYNIALSDGEILNQCTGRKGDAVMIGQ